MPAPPFTQRYERILRSGILVVELPEALRRKLDVAIGSHNHAISVKRNPDDRWIDHSDVVSELVLDISETGLRHPEG
jgi:hypothetical protein